MFQQMLQGGFTPIDFKGLLAAQSVSHGMLTAKWSDDNMVVFCSTMGQQKEKLACIVNFDDEESINKIQELSDRGLINTPIAASEVRFYTHDFADASTWNSKTCGDVSAPYVGGIALHPATGLWLDATGAAMIQAYETPGSGHTGDPTYLYGSLSYLISPQYDDVNYRWVDNLQNSYKNDTTNFPYVNYCYLDISSMFLSIPTPAVWRDGTTNDVVCSFDATLGPNQITNSGTSVPRGSWICNLPTSGTIDSTSSRWRIDPYDGFKIQLREVGMDVEIEGNLEAGRSFRWQPYGEASLVQQGQLEAMGLPSQIAELPFKGTEFVYHTISDFRFGCNNYIQSVVPEPGCVSNTASMVYDYTKTIIPILDSKSKQRLDIVIDDNIPVNKTKMARGTFIAVQYPSF